MRTGFVLSLVALGVWVVSGLPACGGDDRGTEAMHGDGGDAEAASSGDVAVGPSGDASMAADADGGVAACVPSETDGGSCNAIDAIAPMVAATCSMAEPPQATGGVIEDGLYVLQAFTYYGVCPTAPDVVSTIWQICGNHWDVVQVGVSLNDGGPLAPARFNFLTAVQPPSVEYLQSCGATVTLGLRAYTASPGHLMFVYPDATTPGRTFVSVFAKQ